jgi:heptosyltransferase-2
MHLLLIRFSSIGDVVLQTSLFAALKRQYGEKIKLSFLLGAEFKDLLAGHPMLENILTFDRKSQKISDLFLTIIRLHQTKKIDVIIDLHGSLRSSFIRYRFFYIPSIVVDKRKIERFLLIYFKINMFKKRGVIQSQIKRLLCDFSGIFNFSTNMLEISSFLRHQTLNINRLEATITSTTQSFIPEKSSNEVTDTIVFAPSASFENKRWPLEYFIQLAQLIIDQRKEKIVILAGPEDHFCQDFNPLVKNYPNRIFNLQGKTSLNDSIKIISRAKLIVGNDTGLIHIAESHAIRAIVMYGPTSESFGFIPHGLNSKSLSIDIWCRPCSATGVGKCMRSKRYCMINLPVETVFNTLCTTLSTEVNCA